MYWLVDLSRIEMCAERNVRTLEGRGEAANFHGCFGRGRGIMSVSLAFSSIDGIIQGDDLKTLITVV